MSQRPKILISGASRGLGAETAVAAALLGADLVLTARNQEGLEQTAARVTEIRPELKVEIHAGDLADNDFCQDLATRLGEQEGQLDAVVLNAAQIEPIGPLASTDDASWTKAIELNLLAPSRLARRLLPLLVESQGRLVTLGTGASSAPLASWSAYCCSKAALLMLTRVIAVENPSITSLSFSPGVVDTVMQKTIRERHEMMPSDLAGYFQTLHAQGQLLPPEVPGRAIAWCALYAPHEWTGTEVATTDAALAERVRAAFADSHTVKTEG